MTAVAPSPELTPAARPPRLGPVDYALLVGLAVISLCLYAQARHNGFVRFDDPVYVQRNAHVQAGLTLAGLRYAATAIVSSNWHPLTILVEMVAVQLFGPSAATFHLLMDGLHAANVCLLFLFLRLATGRTGRAAAVAALWGWHPLRVESVAWVGELKDVLCGLFWIGGMLAFLWYRQRPSPGRYAAVFGCMAAAGLSKPMAVTLPVALLLLDYWPLGAGWALGSRSTPETSGPAGWWRARLAEQVPLILLSVALGVVTVLTQTRTETTGSLAAFPVGIRLTNAADGYLQYLIQTFVPARMAISYPHPATLGRHVPVGLWLTGLVVLAGVSALTVAARRARPWAFVGWAWFVLTLVPVIGLIQVGLAARADRYTYLPSIGLTIAVVWVVADGVARLAGRAASAIDAGLTAVAAVVLIAVTGVQIGYWRDDRTLATHADAVVPDDYRARSSLALVEVADGHPAEAVRLAKSAAELAPAVAEARSVYATALEADGQLAESFDEFRQAVIEDPNQPYIRNDFGGLLLAQRRDADAYNQFRKAVAIDPDMFDAHLNLGVMLAARHDYPAAVDEFIRAVDLAPHFGPAQGDLANALQLTGDADDAVDHYRLAVADGDDRADTRTQLAWLTAINGRSTPADLAAAAPLAQLATADPVASRQPFPWYAYSVVLARQGRLDEATTAAQQALTLARATKQTDMAAAIQARLSAYAQGLVAAPSTRPTTGPVAAPVTMPAGPGPGR